MEHSNPKIKGDGHEGRRHHPTTTFRSKKTTKTQQWEIEDSGCCQIKAIVETAQGLAYSTEILTTNVAVEKLADFISSAEWTRRDHATGSIRVNDNLKKFLLFENAKEGKGTNKNKIRKIVIERWTEPESQHHCEMIWKSRATGEKEGGKRSAWHQSISTNIESEEDMRQFIGRWSENNRTAVTALKPFMELVKAGHDDDDKNKIESGAGLKMESSAVSANELKAKPSTSGSGLEKELNRESTADDDDLDDNDGLDNVPSTSRDADIKEEEEDQETVSDNDNENDDFEYKSANENPDPVNDEEEEEEESSSEEEDLNRSSCNIS